MQRLTDWIDIFAPYERREESVTLSVSEVARLVFDLQAAQAAIPMKEIRDDCRYDHRCESGSGEG